VLLEQLSSPKPALRKKASQCLGMPPAHLLDGPTGSLPPLCSGAVFVLLDAG